MIVLINFKTIKVILISLVFLIILGTGFYLQKTLFENSTITVDDSYNALLPLIIQQIFDLRNQAILNENISQLENLYDRDVKYGIWAFEHELKKFKYLHLWSSKQGIKFKKINSQIVVRSAKKKGDGFTVNLLVSTEYQYLYENDLEKFNCFRIGTYHSLDLRPEKDKWVIIREWYTDPFADSLQLDELKSQQARQLILSGLPKDISLLNEKRLKTVDYISKYSGAANLPSYGFKYNSNYRNYNNLGGDCANFASQILYEGGGFQKNRTWNYERGAGSRAWINAQAFNNYMLHSGRGSLLTRGSYDRVLQVSYKLLPGDYIAYERKGKVVHISVVSGMDSKGYILVNSHNTDRNRVPWDLGWSNKNITFWLVRVNY